MRALRFLGSIVLLLLAAYSVVAWALWFNPGFGDLFGVDLPIGALDYPGGPQNGTLGISLLCFVLAYVAWPPPVQVEHVQG